MSSRFRGWVAVGLSTRLGIHLFVACTHWLVEAGLLTHIHTCRAVYVVTASKRGFKVGLSPHGELSVAVGIRHAGSSRLGLRQLYKRFPPQASHHRKPVENRFTTAGCLLRSPQASTQTPPLLHSGQDVTEVLCSPSLKEARGHGLRCVNAM